MPLKVKVKNTCINCKSNNLKYGTKHFDVDDNFYCLPITCIECGEDWEDVWTPSEKEITLEYAKIAPALDDD